MQKQFNTFNESLDYIYSKIDFSLTKQQRYSDEVFNLDRMRNFMRALGNPQDSYKTIHVAGTKGKGSISAMIAEVLREAGYKTGFYSSPHMIEYTERIRVNGFSIDENEFIQVLNEIYPIIESIYGLTTFEITTAIAFCYFKKKDVDVAVFEVGLGGRLDATNIIKPILSVISSISMDHMAILGNTLQEIAGEKAGIIKTNTPVIIAPQRGDVMGVFRAKAEEMGSRLIAVKDKVCTSQRKSDIRHQTFTIEYPCSDEVQFQDKKSYEISIPLLGEHQMENASTAFCALKTLQEIGLRINDKDIVSGLAKVHWPGRFEILKENPFLIIDAAHNPESVERLVSTIQELLSGKRVFLIFGASEDKDIKGMLHIFQPVTNKLILTRSVHPRAANPGDMKKMIKDISYDTIVIDDIEEALSYAFKEAHDNDVILASGSIFVASAIREIWFSNYDQEGIQ